MCPVLCLVLLPFALTVSQCKVATATTTESVAASRIVIREIRSSDTRIQNPARTFPAGALKPGRSTRPGVSRSQRRNTGRAAQTAA